MADYSYYFVENDHRKEIVMKNSSVVLPTNVPVGSVAYTGDMSYMAVFDGSEWKQIGGE